MFGLGMGEVVIVLALALVLLGPQQLPDVAKQLGKGLRDFRKATDDLKKQFEAELVSTETKPLAPRRQPPPAEGAGTECPVPAATIENVPGLEAARVVVKPSLGTGDAS
jgi:sec-independent protein translocase protein TatB